MTKLQAEGLQFYQKYASLQVFFKIFDQICTVIIYKVFRNFTNFCFPENLLVVAANRWKILKIFISIKVTVYAGLQTAV